MIDALFSSRLMASSLGMPVIFDLLTYRCFTSKKIRVIERQSKRKEVAEPRTLGLYVDVVEAEPHTTGE